MINIIYNKYIKFLNILLTLLLLCPVQLWALPQGQQVAEGTATFSQPNANTMQINQGSDKAIINYDSFNIAGQETVHFIQPSSSSIAMNRITGGDPSSIFGNLIANGQVFLMNPNGIMFGQGSRVDTNGFMASTLNMTNSDFMNGTYNLFQVPGKNPAYIINQGIINADGAYAVLVAQAIRNEGIIQANLGKIVIGAAEQATLDFTGDGLVNFAISKPVSSQVMGPDGKPMAYSIENKGKVTADGGMVVLTANTAANLVDAVINNDGIIQARSLVEKDGKIILAGGYIGKVENKGTLDASSVTDHVNAGTIDVTGEKILNTGNILANSANYANAGHIRLFAEKILLLSPTSHVEAKATGIQSNGGFIETSSKGSFLIKGVIDASSKYGKAGTWLLDPTDVTIVDVAQGDTVGGGATWDNADWTGATNSITHDTIETFLNAGTSVAITTADSLEAGFGDITVNAAISKTAGGDATFTLNAFRDIILNANITSTVGALGMIFTAARNISQAADVAIDTNGGAFTATATAGTFTMASSATITSGLGDMVITANGDVALASLSGGTDPNGNGISITSTNGAILDANGAATNITTTAPVSLLAKTGINLDTAISGQMGILYAINSGTGDINIANTNDADNNPLAIINPNGSGVALSTADGSITLTNTGSGATAGGITNYLLFPNPPGDPIVYTGGVQATGGNISITSKGNLDINYSAVKTWTADTTLALTSTAGDVMVTGITATGGTALLSAPAGSILDNSLIPADVDITATNLSLSAAHDIGTSGNHLDTAVSGIIAANAGGASGDDIYINNTGNVTIGSVPGGVSGITSSWQGIVNFVNSGNIDIAAGAGGMGADSFYIESTNGYIHSAGATPVFYGFGSGVTLVASTGIGTLLVPIRVNGALDVTTDTGGIFLKILDWDVGVIAQAITSGDINISNTTGNRITATSVSTASGSVTITSNGDDANIEADSISATTGVTLTANSGANTGVVRLGNVSSTGGAITVNALTGISDDGSDATLVSAPVVSLTTAGGNIGALGNDVDIDVSALNAAGLTLSAIAGNIYIKGYNADFALSALATPVLQNGGTLSITADATGNRNISIDQSLDVGGDALLLSATGGSILNSGLGGTLTTTNSLSLLANGNIGAVGDALQTVVTGDLSARSIGGSGIYISNTGAVHIVTQGGGTGGLDTWGGADSIVDFTNTGNIDIDNGAVVQAATSVRLESLNGYIHNSDAAQLYGNFTFVAETGLGEASHPLYIGEWSSVASAVIDPAGAGGNIYITRTDGNGETLSVLAASTPNGTISLTRTNSGSISVGNIHADTAGNTITIASVDAILLGQLSAETVLLSAAGTLGPGGESAIRSNRGAGLNNITATNLSMTSSGGAGTTAAPIETQVTNFAANNTLTGQSIHINNTDAGSGLNIANLTAVGGVNGITETSTAGDVMVITTTQSLNINAPITTNNGVSLTATNGAITGNAALPYHIIGNAPFVNLQAATGIGSSSALKTNLTGNALLNAHNDTSGNIQINNTSADDLWIITVAGATLTAPALYNGGSGSISITNSGGGSILTGVDTTGLIGDYSVGQIQLNGGNLTLTTIGGGDIKLGTAVTTGGGNVTLTSAGGIELLYADHGIGVTPYDASVTTDGGGYKAYFDSDGVGAEAYTMDTGSSIDVGSGYIFIYGGNPGGTVGGGDVTLGRLIAGNGSPGGPLGDSTISISTGDRSDPGSHESNITFKDTVTTTGGKVALSATGNIEHDANVTTGGGAYVAYFDSNASSAGTFDSHLATIDTGSGYIFINGGVIGLNTGGGNVSLGRLVSSSSDMLGGIYNIDVRTSGGDITLAGVGSGAGNGIDWTGTGGSGVFLEASGAINQNANVSTTSSGVYWAIANSDNTVVSPENYTMAAGTSITSNGGSLTIYNGSSGTAEGNLNLRTLDSSGSSGGDVTLRTGGNITHSGNVTTGGGNYRADFDADRGGSVIGTFSSDGYAINTGSGYIVIYGGLLGVGPGGGNVTLGPLTSSNSQQLGGVYNIDVRTAGGYIDVNGLINHTGASGTVFLNASDVITQNANVTTTGANVNFTAGGDITAGNINADSGNINLTSSGGAISDPLGTLTTSGAVILSAANGIGTALNPINTVINNGTLTGYNTTSGGFYLTNTGDLTIVSQGQLSGLNNDGGALTLINTGSLALDTGSQVTSTGGTFTINNTGDIVIGANALVGAMAADAFISATGAISQAAGSNVVLAAGTNNTLTINAGTTYTMADGAAINANFFIPGSGNSINLTSGGNMSITGISADNAVTLTSTAGEIIDAGNTSTDVTAASLAMSAARGIGSSDAIETAVSNLAATNSTSGNIKISNTGSDLNVTTVGSVSGIINSGSGNISLATGDSTTISQAISAANGGNILLTLASGNNNINSSLSTNTGTDGGSVTITAAGLSFNANGDITTNGTSDGNISITTNSHAITMVDGTVFDAGTGKIILDSHEGIALGQLLASGGTVLLTSSGGAGITSARAAGQNNITAANLSINSSAGVGSAASPIETQVINLAAQISGSTSNAPTINNTDAGSGLNIADLTGVGGVSGFDASGYTSGDNISVTTSGALNINAAMNIATGINLTAGNNVGINAAITLLNGAGLYLTSTSGAISGDAGLTYHIIGTGGSLVALHAATGIGSSSALKTNLTSNAILNAHNDISGNIQIDNTSADDLWIITVGGFTLPAPALYNGGSGNISITNDGGGSILTGVDTTPFIGDYSVGQIQLNGGNLTLTTTGGGDIKLGDVVTTGGGSVDINSSGAFELLNATHTGLTYYTGSINTSNGSVDVDATGAITLDNGSTLNAGTNTVDLTGVGIGVTGVTGSTVTLNAGSGAITDNGDTNMDVTATSLIIPAASSVATSINPLDVAITNLGATTTTNGGIYINDIGGLNVTGNVSTGNTGAINLVTTASGLNINDGVTVNAGAHTVDLTGVGIGVTGVTGSTVTLNAGSGAITDNGDTNMDVTATSLSMTAATGIGAAGNALETVVSNIAANNSGIGVINIDNTGNVNVNGLSTRGNITFTAHSDINVNAQVNSHGGDINLTASDNLNVNSSNPGILSSGGNIHIEATSGDATITGIDSSNNGLGGNVVVRAGGDILNSVQFSSGIYTISTGSNDNATIINHVNLYSNGGLWPVTVNDAQPGWWSPGFGTGVNPLMIFFPVIQPPNNNSTPIPPNDEDEQLHHKKVPPKDNKVCLSIRKITPTQ